MTKLQIQEVLENAYKKDFLDSIEYLFQEEKEYKKSNFFKATRIPLAVLYEKFYMTKTKENLANDLVNVFMEFDVEYLVIKFEQFIEGFKDSEKINDWLEKILSYFDTEKISEYRDDIQGIFDKVLNK